MQLKTTQKIQILLSAAGTDVEYTAHVVDDSGTALAYDTLAGASNGTTPVDAIPAPASGTRIVRYLEIANKSATVTWDVTVRMDVSGTARAPRTWSLPPGATITYVQGEGWKVTEANGAPRVQHPSSRAVSGTKRTLFKTGTAAEAAGNWYCTAKDAGAPGAITVGTPGLNGRAVIGSTEGGSIALPTPTGEWYLTHLALAASTAHAHIIFDLLWINSGIVVTTTTGQSITSPTWPARDADGATAGRDCMIGLLVTAATTNAGAIANSTVTYTNSAGTGSRTATLVAVAGSQIPATAVVGTIVWFSLQAGDVGVQSIQSVALGTSLVTGSVSLFVARWIAMAPNTAANVAQPALIDADPGIGVWDNPALFHAYQASATTASTVAGTMAFADRA